MAKSHYAIIKGHETGIFEKSWDEVKPLVHGFPGARYKGFDSEEEARGWYELNKPTNIERGGLVAYVDGSNTGDGSAASWAYVLAFEDEIGDIEHIIHGAFGVVDERTLKEFAPSVKLSEALTQRNVLGELMAGFYAMKQAWEFYKDELYDKPLTLYHDYEGVCMWATGAWKRRSELTRWYHAQMNTYVEDDCVRFVHVKGHTGNIGNELVDDLAALALGRGMLL